MHQIFDDGTVDPARETACPPSKSLSPTYSFRRHLSGYNKNSLFLHDPLEILYSLSQALPADRLRKEVAVGFTSLFVGPPLTMFVYGEYLGWTFQVPPVQNLQQALWFGLQTYLFSYVFVPWFLNLLWPMSIVLYYFGSRSHRKSILKDDF